MPQMGVPANRLRSDQSAGGVSPDQVAAKRVDYQRATRACLEGRGYSVR